jgi:hypothetical protein
MAQSKFVRQLASEAVEKPEKLLQLISYHAYSIWLFTYNDIHIMLLPETAFGVLHALWFTENSANNPVGPTSNDVVERIPLVLYWVWINLLAFNISNQRGPESIAEDAINKPWRTMPSGRWSTQLASYAHKLAYSGALASSWFIGGLRPCIVLTILGERLFSYHWIQLFSNICIIGFWYNDFGGGDGRAVTRNFINACVILEVTFDQEKNKLTRDLITAWALLLLDLEL